MRGADEEMRGVDSTLETISAAATVIASAENREPHVSIQKRRWRTRWWSAYWCFGSHKHKKRIGQAVIVPGTTSPETEVPASQNPTQSSALVRPFIAPPSSPASFHQSEPPSTSQSPTGPLSLNSISSNIYSPDGPSSIFAIGPYAHETQLVSPPVFSAFPTEPSTAPFTPPPESVQLTTPSSPEVPFARLLDSNRQNGEAFSHREFQSYQLFPGHIISPRSGISSSGTLSPFPDHEFSNGWPHFHEFHTQDPPKLLESDVAPPTASFNKETIYDHRVSFEITAEDVIRCVEKKAAMCSKTVLAYLENADHGRNESSSETPRSEEKDSADGDQNRSSITVGPAKEFKFDNVNGGNADKTGIGSEWWANEKIHGKESAPCKNWSFFPTMPQPGIS